MNEIQKEQIKQLRTEGYGYKKIAILLDISENTIKSFCRRNDLNGDIGNKNTNVEVIKSRATKEEKLKVTNNSYCANCGKVLVQVKGIKTRKFCSDECRKLYWTSNQFKINRKSATEYVCSVCGNKYIDYARNNRKYCSRECYVKNRFKGGVINGEC